MAMTCTHAAIARRQLLALGFRYDNLVMEEAAQVLELETIIPMLLQPAADSTMKKKKKEKEKANAAAMDEDDESDSDGDAEDEDGGVSAMAASSSSASVGGGGRLLRVCLIGDHHQLPPVVQNQVLAKYSHLDQTLFTVSGDGVRASGRMGVLMDERMRS